MVKLNVFVYGTCQSGAVIRFLQCNDSFTSRFKISEAVLSYMMISESINFADDPKYLSLLNSADVFFYQPVRDSYGKNATDYLKTLLNKDCLTISMPYIYNSCTWPLAPALKRDFTDEWIKGIGEQLVLINKESIDILIDKGMSAMEILSMYDNGTLDFCFEDRLKTAFDITREKEVGLDIKVGKFIEENIRKKRLFLYCSHPTSHVFIHAANQLLDILECAHLSTDFPLDYCEISTCGMPLPYPQASGDYFNFEFSNEGDIASSNRFFRNLIIGHLNAKNIK